MPFSIEIGIDEHSPHREIGPFDSYEEARERGRVFQEEGLDVVVTRSDHVCDFCSSISVYKQLVAHNVILPDIGWASRGNWAACEECWKVISSNQPQVLKVDALVERSVARAKELHGGIAGEEFFATGVRMIQDAFFSVWTGEVIAP